MTKKQSFAESDAEPTAPPTNAEIEAQPTAAGITFARSADYRTIFSNITRTRIGNGEVTLIFSRVAHAPNNPAAVGSVIEDQVEIVLTWIQLKIFNDQLTAVVMAIDEEVGEIKLPMAIKTYPEVQRTNVRSLGFPPPNKTEAEQS